jgi:hypothetical protein
MGRALVRSVKPDFTKSAITFLAAVPVASLAALHAS